MSSLNPALHWSYSITYPNDFGPEFEPLTIQKQDNQLCKWAQPFVVERKHKASLPTKASQIVLESKRENNDQIKWQKDLGSK